MFVANECKFTTKVSMYKRAAFMLSFSYLDQTVIIIIINNKIENVSTFSLNVYKLEKDKIIIKWIQNIQNKI